MSNFDAFQWTPNEEEIRRFAERLTQTEGGRQLIELVNSGTIKVPETSAPVEPAKVTRKEVTAVIERRGLEDTPENRAEVREQLQARATREAAQQAPAAPTEPAAQAPTNQELGQMPIAPGGVTFGEAEQIMGGIPLFVPPGATAPAGTGTSAPAGGTGAVEETETERIARLDREQAQSQFDAIQAGERAATEQRRENAFGIIQQFFQRAGLQGLETQVRQLLAEGIEDSDAILFRLRDTQQFKTRFAGNAARADRGLPELDPATYIGLEQAYRATLVANGLPKDFYDSPDDFTKLIEGDVSPAEFQARINQGYTAVRNADPQVLNQIRQYYPEIGNDDRALAAYFIDPQRSITALQRQVEAARIGARGREQAGFQIEVGTAEELVRRGITAEQAQGAFERAGQLAGLYQEIGGEQALTTEQKVGAALGFNTEAERELQLRQRRRLAEFQGGGGFARTTGATSGTAETGIGTAQ